MKAILLSLLLCIAASLSPAAEEPLDPQPFFLKLIGSLEKNDYKTFVEAGDADFQAAMTPALIQGVSKQLAPRMKGVYGVAYFGSMKKKDYETHLWKLTFKDGGDDILMSVSIRGDKVVGFIIK